MKEKGGKRSENRPNFHFINLNSQPPPPAANLHTTPRTRNRSLVGLFHSRGTLCELTAVAVRV
eukprot:scaffold34415_cov143-Skeletonema_menzelii.AAC.6